jgi:hypothetical protein
MTTPYQNQNFASLQPIVPIQSYGHQPDGMASEYELGDFLYGLVRLMKPNTVLRDRMLQRAYHQADWRSLEAEWKGKSLYV